MTVLSGLLFVLTGLSFLLEGYEGTKLLTLAATGLLWFANVTALRDRALGFINPFAMFTLSFMQYYLIPPLDTVYFHQIMTLPTVIYGHISPYNDWPMIRGLITSLIGLVGAILGYQVYVLLIGKPKYVRPTAEWSFDPIRLKLTALMCLVLGVSSYAALLYSIGLSTYLQTQREMRAYLMRGTEGWDVFAYFWETGLVLFSVYLIEVNREHLRRALIIIVILFIIPTIVLIGFISGSRILIVRPALIVGFYLLVTTGHTALRPRTITLFLIIAVIAVVGAVARRFVGVNLSFALANIGAHLDPASLYLIITQSFDFTSVHDMYLLLHNRAFDFGYGDTYLKVFYQFIPRTFWPGKPENITAVAAATFRPDLWAAGVSINPSFLGEMYYNFGNWGVGILSCVVGAALAALTCWGLAIGNNPPLRLIYVALVVSIIEQGRGAFSNILNTYLIFYVLPVLFVARRRVCGRSCASAQNLPVHGVPAANSH